LTFDIFIWDKAYLHKFLPRDATHAERGDATAGLYRLSVRLP